MDRSWKNIVEEWEKCIMLCANCHRICHNIGE
jgi:predicted HNH restriction endonuclease